MSVSDVISIIAILVSLFSLGMSLYIQKTLTEYRSLKDVLINDTVALRDLYINFIHDMVEGKYNRQDIITEFRFLSLKLQGLADICNGVYKNHILEDLTRYNGNFKWDITSLEEIDASNSPIILSSQSQSIVITGAVNLNNHFLKSISAINNARYLHSARKFTLFGYTCRISRG